MCLLFSALVFEYQLEYLINILNRILPYVNRTILIRIFYRNILVYSTKIVLESLEVLLLYYGNIVK